MKKFKIALAAMTITALTACCHRQEPPADDQRAERGETYVIHEQTFDN